MRIEHSGTCVTALRGCSCWGLVQRLPIAKQGERPVCIRCASPLTPSLDPSRSLQRTAAAALGALVLYLPALTLPLIEIERLGHRRISSLAGGTYELLLHGDVWVGLVILAFSIVLPLTKIALLLELSLLRLSGRRFRAVSHRWIERLGRWSMMDVLMLAMLVMVVKLGDLVTVRLGPAVWAFAGSVALGLIASACFDPHAMWREEER